MGDDIIMNKDIKYYIAGPMNGLPEFNYPNFKLMEEHLVSTCGIPLENILNPINIADGDTSKEYSYYIRHAIEMVLKADAIIFLNGWEYSTGARLEFNIGKLLGLELYHQNMEKFN